MKSGDRMPAAKMRVFKDCSIESVPRWYRDQEFHPLPVPVTPSSYYHHYYSSTLRMTVSFPSCEYRAENGDRASMENTPTLLCTQKLPQVQLPTYSELGRAIAALDKVCPVIVTVR